MTNIVNKTLSTQLCTGIMEWFKQNEYFNNTFKSIVDYVRLDFPSTELPGIAVYYYKSPSTYSDTWNEVGQIAIDVAFSLKAQRDQRAKEIIETLEMIKAQLLDNPVYIFTFVEENFVPGLQRLVTRSTFNDIANLKQKMLNAKNGSLVVTFSLDYSINIYLNQKALRENNVDYYSPTKEIYTDAIVDTKFIINPEQKE